MTWVSRHQHDFLIFIRRRVLTLLISNSLLMANVLGAGVPEQRELRLLLWLACVSQPCLEVFFKSQPHLIC